MANLLKETIEILEENDKTFDDVIGICGEEFQISIEDFKRLANQEYDDGYGSQEVAEDLVIVGKDFWLERHEYDGSEWWEYKSNFELSSLPFVKVKRIIGGMWCTLAEMQDDENL